MKKKVLLIMLVVLLSSIGALQRNVNVEAEVTTETWDKAYAVSQDKVWNVAFNTKMSPSSFTSDTVYVMNNSTKSKHPVTFSLSSDGKVLSVKPTKPYTMHQEYTLHVDQKVASSLNRTMIKSIELPFLISNKYVITDFNGKALKSYNDLDTAIANAATDNTQMIQLDGTTVWIQSGIARTKAYTLIYDSPTLQKNITYVSGESELQYVKSYGEILQIKVAGKTGYVEADKVNLIPYKLATGKRSYYKNVDGDLYHYIYTSSGFGVYKYGAAPANMANGAIAYSWDGKTFNGQTAFFLNQRDLRTPSSVTAAELDNYIKANKADSPMIGLGKTFIEMEKQYNVNAVYLMAHAIHESAWGMSKIAREKNNLYGINATDSNPYGNADTYKSYEGSVMYAAKYISDKYLTSGTWQYNGRFLGNKAEGMNVRYASDPFWGQKIAGHMYRAEQWIKANR
ncbi:N-acetylglucosaminidase [Radiobacillus deserti]|uniref:Mannosyl-glycoprotein endo-beta-N-acetylglucosamidase-like domain-containing protein n=1 Tax=Radiobacillus deserti TaxID=2594883 RepID=A0A516KJM8_9BACI|nr:glucosaminidase domain-containing protein [Radiobacillus deserti]QDP41592.1 hypothetical protein FN924_16295 [Radiobacillus deserti]